MNKRAIILDLDNTLYPVSAIAGQLFERLFRLLEESGELAQNLDAAKDDIMRKPFQTVAAKFCFSDALTKKGLQLLQNLTYNGPIAPFSDYSELKQLPQKKFLVTSGFEKLQHSKIRHMGIDQDFAEIHVVDVEQTTKKDVFARLLQRNNYQPADVLVVGDDPQSELKAARELGIDAVLYDKFHRHRDETSFSAISSFQQLPAFL